MPEGRAAPPQIRPPGLLARLRPHLLDLTPLRRSPDLRRLIQAEAVSTLGSQATRVAIPFQVYALTGSTAAVGLVGVAELVPNVALAALGGALADRADRRRLLMAANAAFAVVSLALAANALSASPRVVPLYGFALASGALTALSVPAVRAWPARLVPAELLTAAFALDGATWNANALAGPAVAGVLIGGAGVSAAYLVDAASFVCALALVARMAPSRPPAGAGEDHGSIAEGFRVVLRQPVVATVLSLDAAAMLFGMPLALLPALAGELGAGPVGLGLLYAAPAAGGLTVALLSGSAGRLRRPGLGVLVALGGWSLAIVVVGLAPVVWLAWAGLAVAGGANQLSALLGTAVSLTAVPDEVRGRLAAVDQLVSEAGPALGDAESGLVASAIGVGPTIVLGGVLSLVAVALIGAVGRSLRAVRLAPEASAAP